MNFWLYLYAKFCGNLKKKYNVDMEVGQETYLNKKNYDAIKISTTGFDGENKVMTHFLDSFRFGSMQGFDYGNGLMPIKY